MIDGVQVADDDPLPEWLQIIFLDEETYPFPIPVGYEAAAGPRQFINLDTENHRFEFICDPAWALGLVYDNPTVIEFTDVVGQHTGVCLSPQPPFTITCTPEKAQQSVQLFKARDSLPFLTFANVAFNIYENGVQIGSQLSLLNLTAMEGIGLEIVANDGTNRLITISSMDGVNNRAIQLEPTMGIMNDVDITQGNVVKHDGSFFMCLAKKPI